jgi:hypothetical protein
LSDLIKFEIPRQILENIQVSDLIKICPVEAKLFLAGGRTDTRRN